MIRRCALSAVLSLSAAVASQPVHAQAVGTTGTTVNGRVVVQVFVTLSDEATMYHPVAGLQLGFTRSARDTAIAVPAPSGSATLLLAPGQYRLVSLMPTQWKGMRYSWNMAVVVREDMSAIAASRRRVVSRAVTTVTTVSNGESAPASSKARQCRFAGVISPSAHLLRCPRPQGAGSSGGLVDAPVAASPFRFRPGAERVGNVRRSNASQTGASRSSMFALRASPRSARTAAFRRTSRAQPSRVKWRPGSRLRLPQALFAVHRRGDAVVNQTGSALPLARRLARVHRGGRAARSVRRSARPVARCRRLSAGDVHRQRRRCRSRRTECASCTPARCRRSRAGRSATSTSSGGQHVVVRTPR